MKKLTLILVLLLGTMSVSNANETTDNYNKAVLAHVVKETVSGNGVDVSVLEAEMSKLAYNFALEMTDVIEKHLPVILESLAAEMRMKADQEYKCKLLEGGTYECK